MPDVDLCSLENWSDAAGLDQGADDLLAAGSRFSENITTYAVAFRAMAAHYAGPGGKSLNDLPPEIRAFGEGCRALASLAHDALHQFAWDLSDIEHARASAWALGSSYNNGLAVRRYYLCWLTSTDGARSSLPDVEILAEAPFNPWRVQRDNPDLEHVELSPWRPVDRGLEDSEGHRLALGHTVDNPTTTQEVTSQIQHARSLYDRHIEETVKRLSEARVDSAAFNAEVSKNDSFFDNPVGNILGLSEDINDLRKRPPRTLPPGPTVEVHKPNPPSRIGWIELLLVVADEYQDSRTRVEVAHPEWGWWEKEVNVAWQTVIHTGTASTIGVIESMLSFGFRSDAIWALLGLETADMIYSGAGLDDVIADWIIKTLRGDG